MISTGLVISNLVVVGGTGLVLIGLTLAAHYGKLTINEGYIKTALMILFISLLLWFIFKSPFLAFLNY